MKTALKRLVKHFCIAISLAYSSVTIAETREDILKNIVACMTKTENLEQIKCHLDYIEGNFISDDKTVSTKDMGKKFAANEFSNVDPKDLQLGPRKFMGKPIELRNMQCFFADLNEYRCWSSGSASVTIFTSKIADHPEKSKFDDVCGKSANTSGPLCRKTIRLVPSEWDEDQPNAFSKRTIIKTKEIEFASKANPQKR